MVDTEIKKLIIKLLGENPNGLSAREIARRLDILKRDANRVLYNSRDKDFSLAFPTWKLLSDDLEDLNDSNIDSIEDYDTKFRSNEISLPIKLIYNSSPPPTIPETRIGTLISEIRDYFIPICDDNPSYLHVGGIGKGRFVIKENMISNLDLFLFSFITNVYYSKLSRSTPLSDWEYLTINRITNFKLEDSTDFHLFEYKYPESFTGDYKPDFIIIAILHERKFFGDDTNYVAGLLLKLAKEIGITKKVSSKNDWIIENLLSKFSNYIEKIEQYLQNKEDTDTIVKSRNITVEENEVYDLYIDLDNKAEFSTIEADNIDDVDGVQAYLACSHCGETLPREDYLSKHCSYTEDGFAKIICKRCLAKILDVCNLCGRIVETDELHNTFGKKVCLSCEMENEEEPRYYLFY